MKSFLQAFRRFSGRRDLPSILVSDNASWLQGSRENCQFPKGSAPSLKQPSDVEIYSGTNSLVGVCVGGGGGGGGRLGEADTKCERCLKKTVGRTSLD